MKKLLMASVAVIAMGVGPVVAQEAAAGGAAGGAAGAVAGGIIFGPIGAIIGGFTGAVIGAEAAVDDEAIEYARLNATEPVVVEGDVDVGFMVPEEVTIHAVEGHDDIGYFYTDDRLYFVNLSDRTVIYSPGTVVAVQGN